MEFLHWFGFGLGFALGCMVMVATIKSLLPEPKAKRSKDDERFAELFSKWDAVIEAQNRIATAIEERNQITA